MAAATFNTWEMAIRGDVRPKMVPESRQTYAGERPSMLSFFFQFPEIIFRWRGSVIPYVLIEIFLAVGLSFLALYACPDEKFSPVGHQLVGVLLAFLVVFRSQISWGMYMEGRNHVGALFATSRVLAIQMMEDFASAGGSTSENADFASKIRDAEDSLRLLKLYFYLVVEHGACAAPRPAARQAPTAAASCCPVLQGAPSRAPRLHGDIALSAILLARVHPAPRVCRIETRPRMCDGSPLASPLARRSALHRRLQRLAVCAVHRLLLCHRNRGGLVRCRVVMHRPPPEP